jgi:hypothetical protein
MVNILGIIIHFVMHLTLSKTLSAVGNDHIHVNKVVSLQELLKLINIGHQLIELITSMAIVILFALVHQCQNMLRQLSKI